MGHQRWWWLATFACTPLVLAQTVQDRDPRRPAHLDPIPSCEIWRGTNSGNDPTQEVELRLCPSGASEVTGQVQYSSLNSGWTERAFTGSWSPDRQHLTLHETTMLVSRPNPGWRFCLAERYDLTRGGPDQLTGTYVSQACEDHGQLTLRRVGTQAPTADPPTVPIPARPAVQDEPRRRRGWRCDAGAVAARPASVTHLALALLSWRPRRRNPAKKQA